MDQRLVCRETLCTPRKATTPVERKRLYGGIELNYARSRKRSADSEEQAPTPAPKRERRILLGKGASAYVYAATFTDGRPAVIKEMVFDERLHPDRAIDEECFVAEKNIHAQLRACKDIVRLLAVHHEPGTSGSLVLDRCETTLHKWLQRHGECGTRDTVRMMRQLVSAVAYCHALRIIHRDIKPENILVDAQGNAKLADFGLAHQFASDYDATVGRVCMAQSYVTLWYRAPELYLCDVFRGHGGRRELPVTLRHSYAADMWSLGCVLAELRCAMPLFPAECDIDLFFRVHRTIGSPSSKSWACGHAMFMSLNLVPPKHVPTPFDIYAPRFGQHGIDLLRRMVCMAPGDRITAAETLAHPYLATKAE